MLEICFTFCFVPPTATFGRRFQNSKGQKCEQTTCRLAAVPGTVRRTKTSRTWSQLSSKSNPLTCCRLKAFWKTFCFFFFKRCTFYNEIFHFVLWFSFWTSSPFFPPGLRNSSQQQLIVLHMFEHFLERNHQSQSNLTLDCVDSLRTCCELWTAVQQGSPYNTNPNNALLSHYCKENPSKITIRRHCLILGSFIDLPPKN